MTNEEKIISMLGKMQADIEELKEKANFQIDNETPEQYEARKKSLLEFIDRPLTPEEKQEAEEFAEYIAELDARKAAM